MVDSLEILERKPWTVVSTQIPHQAGSVRRRRSCSKAAPHRGALQRSAGVLWICSAARCAAAQEPPPRRGMVLTGLGKTRIKSITLQEFPAVSIYKNITETMGGTPLVMLNKMAAGLGARVALKMESHNPAGSVKDRIGVAMIEAAEKQRSHPARHVGHCRADQRQHRHRPGLCLRRQGLSAHFDHARKHEPGAPPSAAGSRRGTGPDAR